MRLCTSAPDSVFSVQYGVCKELIARMARRCEQSGVRFALASVPLVYGRDDDASIRALDASFQMDFFDLELAAFADSSGFAFIPSTMEFARRENEGLQWAHWSYAGHRLVGGLMAGAIVHLGESPVPVRPPSD